MNKSYRKIEQQLNRVNLMYLDNGIEKTVYIYFEPKDEEVIKKILDLKKLKDETYEN